MSDIPEHKKVELSRASKAYYRGFDDGLKSKNGATGPEASTGQVDSVVGLPYGRAKMDESLKCECGETVFWWYGEYVRCPDCFNEMKQTEQVPGKPERWLRRFNNETHRYDKNWEHF